MNPAFQLCSVDKSFGSGESWTPALKQANFEGQPGEMLFLVGPSGCGKTTLLSILCGTLLADSGDINVLGNSLHRMNDREVTSFRARHIGFIFQQFNLIPTLTAEENVSVPLLIENKPADQARRLAAGLLEKVGLADKCREYPARLSVGQQQRVAIARALVHEPSLVVCDEPTSSLDSATGHQVMELLRDVARDGKRAVVVVTHDPRIYGYAERMAEMEDGRIQRWWNSPEEIAAAHAETLTERRQQ
ncbi:ATP-binding cassette domain-containing protein [bacterium]|nr:ATP-binding cassette domain-containing protein [bacterium]